MSYGIEVCRLTVPRRGTLRSARPCCVWAARPRSAAHSGNHAHSAVSEPTPTVSSERWTDLRVTSARWTGLSVSSASWTDLSVSSASWTDLSVSQRRRDRWMDGLT
eukprot:5990935-Prymnesium_polylepis.3